MALRDVSTKNIREELTALGDFLIAQEMILDLPGISDTGTELTWNGASAAPLIRDFGRFTNIGDYREWIINRQYTMLLNDGALVQVSYSFVDGEVVNHRLAYVPCPVSLDQDLLALWPVVDVLDYALNEGSAAMTMVSPVRFDFDLKAASERHPHSHLTINASGCRIPCLAPLKLGHFVQFMFEHFYPQLWLGHEYLRQFDRDGFGPPTMSDAQAHGLHINWRSPVPNSART